MDLSYDSDSQISMDNDDNTDWTRDFSDNFSVQEGPSSVKNRSVLGKSGVTVTPMKDPSQRIILHFDLDCFYAQVEMIRNPELRNKPLGVQQKYLIVTCNYVARECGVTKLMSATAAKERCPQLVLVSGEDLTHYREISYKVTELLEGYSPLVERLGFDENFVDVTDVVEAKLRREPLCSNFSVKGHIYNQQSLDTRSEDHVRLAIGSHIAAEIREALHSKLGLTGCAGVATSKLLAKLVSGTFKPNQQTTLLPESTADLMGSQAGLRKVPVQGVCRGVLLASSALFVGVGHRTAQRLQALGLTNVKDLQDFPLPQLQKEFGAAAAQRLNNLSLGIDIAPVTPSGPPQSLSDEDSFKKVSTETEVLEKIEELLSSLLERMHKDGRQPRTVRLTIRRFSAANKWFSRESRQCPVPSNIGKKISSGSQEVKAPLVDIAMKLFHKMIDRNKPFHLTLLNICFSNLQARGSNTKGSIGFFFTQRSPGKPGAQVNSCLGYALSDTSLCEAELVCGTEAAVTTDKPPGTPPETCSLGPGSPPSPPPGVDPGVFRQLPDYIQRELKSSTPLATSPSPSIKKIHTVTAPGQADQVHSSLKHSSTQKAIECMFRCPQNAPCWDTGEHDKGHTQPSTWTAEEGTPSSSHCSFPDRIGNTCTDSMSTDLHSQSGFPPNVDPLVFSEFPAELQRELLSDWRQQKPVSKITGTKKLAKSRPSKETKSTAKSSQANNLLKYFKPC